MNLFLNGAKQSKKKNVWKFPYLYISTYYEDRLFQKAEEYGSLNHET